MVKTMIINLIHGFEHCSVLPIGFCHRHWFFLSGAVKSLGVAQAQLSCEVMDVMASIAISS